MVRTDRQDTLVELAERCEKATGPDTSIDEQILFALGWTQRHDEGLNVWQWFDPAGNLTAHRRNDPMWLRYTASLDAAMTLVPEGWLVRDLCHWNTFISTPETAWTVALVNGKPHQQTDGAARKAALALCAAALRARAQQVKHG